MSTDNSPASPASPRTQPSQLSGGLHLTGTVIAVRTEEKEWEKEKYTQTIVSISDGEQVYLLRHRHDAAKPWTIPPSFNLNPAVVAKSLHNRPPESAKYTT